MNKWFWAFLLILSLPFTGNAQSVDSLRFFKIHADLSQHSVTRIIQDKDGYLWFATRYGLNRYDGETVLSFYGTESRNGVLGNSFIKDLALDSAGVMYIATYGGGVNTYHDGAFETVIAEQDPENLLVNNVAIDQKGSLWIGTDKTGVIRLPQSSGRTFSKRAEHFRHYDADDYTLSGNSISGLAVDAYGNTWIGTWDQGLNVYVQESGRFMRLNSSTTPELTSNIIRCIRTGPDGSVWVGFQKGIRRISYSEGGYEVRRPEVASASFEETLEGLTVLSVLHDRDDRLWIGTENEGLIVLDLSTGTHKQYKKQPDNPFALGSNSIWSLYQDAAGTIWIGTFDQGVYKVDPHEVRFDHIGQVPYSKNTLSHSLVSSFAPDANGLWIGTDGGGLNYLSDNGVFKAHTSDNSQLRSSSVLSLLKDMEGNLWIGGWRNGLNMLKEGTNNIYAFPYDGGEKGTGGPFVFDIHQDENGVLYIASFRTGLDIYLPEEDRFLHFTPEDKVRQITASTVQAVTVTQDGVIWVGTEGSGVDRLEINQSYETKSLKNYSLNNKTGVGAVSSVTVLFTDSKGRLWAGTRGDGLARYDSGKDMFTTITTQDGLPSNLIYSIEEDSLGHLWLSTNKGIVSYHPDNGKVETYDVADGLQGLEYFPRASLTLDDGTMVFGGINGFNRFNPAEIASIPLNGRVRITGFQVTGTREDDARPSLIPGGEQEEPIRLDYNNNDFSVSFSYLNFTQSAKNRYQYRLEGYDEGWQEAETRNTAFYTNVPAGNYTFWVRAANADQVWSEESASLKISVSPPWYASWWAYVVYGIITIAFLLWRRRTIIQREKLKNKLALEHLELQKMKELDEIKSRFFANISHEFRTPLTLILSPLKSMLFEEGVKEYHPRLRSMGRQAERLLGFINQILDLSKLEAGSTTLEAREVDLGKYLKPVAYSFTNLAEKQYIRYKVILPDEPLLVYVDTDKLEKIVINLLSNAFKFTPDFGEIVFKLYQTDGKAVIQASDTGQGISRENLEHIFKRYYQGEHEDKRHSLGTGIGLALTKELVELHHGTIEVSSKVGKGTVFTVCFPLGKEHLEEGEIVEVPREEKSYDQDLISDEGNAEKEPAKDNKKRRRGKILVAEDNQEIRSFIKEYLESEFEVLEAPDGAKALELAKDQKPDLVITDVLMPNMDGMELVKAIKNDEALNHISTIMLTAKASAASMERGYELGADFYITKPFNPTHLRLQVQNILKARKNYKERVKNGRHINLAPKQVQTTSEEEELMANVMNVIEQHMSDPGFTVNELCKAVGMSRMQLYRKLKAHISMSANELIRHVRLQRSAQLLKNGQHSVSEITYMVGFTDLQYFRNSFKKHFGVNPSEYV